MGVDEYLAAREKAKSINATVTHTFAKASVALVDSLMENGMVNHDKLKDANTRKAAVDVYYKEIGKQAKKYFGLDNSNVPPLDTTRLDQLTFAYSGLGKEIITDYLENGFKQEEISPVV